MAQSIEAVRANRATCKRQLHALFNGPTGDTLRAFILSELGVDSCFSESPYITYFNLGQREAMEKLFSLGDSTHE